MKLPEGVECCLTRLEDAGFACYAVGGCVRDWLLGLQPHDYDLCTAAAPETIKALFADHGMVLAGEKHGTVGVITPGGVVEITTFRTEAGYADNRHPDQVCFVADVTEDLARRDFTVNAMAWSPIRGLADPFGGREDLKNKMLRAVGDPAVRFQEDALRILRGVRFAARFDLKPEESTLQAMRELAPLMDNLARERVFDELCKLLICCTAEDLLQYAPVITQVIPELEPLMGFCQHSRHHVYDVYEHTAHVVEAVPPELNLRWAALLHDVGKPETFTRDGRGEGHFYGHAEVSATLAEQVLRRLKAPNQLRESVVSLVRLHMTQIVAEKKTVRRWMGRLGEDTLSQLLLLQQADMGSKGTGIDPDGDDFARINTLMDEIRAENACLTLRDLAVKGNDLMALGLQGREVGAMLQYLLEQVMEEKLDNEKTALLAAVKNKIHG